MFRKVSNKAIAGAIAGVLLAVGYGVLVIKSMPQPAEQILSSEGESDG